MQRVEREAHITFERRNKIDDCACAARVSLRAHRGIIEITDVV